jgi:cysteine desulfurase/selenocysteine lyase
MRGVAKMGITAKSSRDRAVTEGRSGTHVFDVERVRADFPILATKSHGKPLVYLDNGATTQKPQAVIDRLVRFYTHENANIHRGVYDLSQRATEAYESARRTVRAFVNAAEDAEIIFTRGTTEAINLVASSFGRTFVRRGDEVIVSSLEHHSNIVPWQMACDAAGATLRTIPINDAGELVMEAYEALLSPRTKLVAVNHVSNALGTINPVERITALAHAVGAKVLIDGAQWVAHHPTDVRALDADFYCFSGHKLFGPTGIGVLYGRRALLDAMPPYQGGGDMIRSVTFAKTEYAELPNKFEAGTPDIAGAVGLAAAIDYVTSVGFENFEPHERDLLAYATKRLGEVTGLRVVGTAKHKAGVVSFVMDDPVISPLDLGTQLDAEGIAVRTGHHCCQPIMDRFCIPATTRASLAMYNTRGDVDALVDALQMIRDRAVNRAAAAPKPSPAVQASPAAGGSDGGGIQYPQAAAASPNVAADDLVEVFEMLGDRDARNEFVIELGAKVPHTFDLLKKVTERVPGCMSEVYVVGRRKQGTPDTLEFLADANADIVRGLIAILTRLFSGQRAADVLAFDVQAFFQRIGLDQFISTQRRNGLEGMVRRIRAMAAELQAK